jgi:hypothetical protein
MSSIRNCYVGWQLLEEMPVFYNMNVMEKREVLVCVLQCMHHLDDATLIKAWQQSAAQTRLFFKLLVECQDLFEVTLHSDYHSYCPNERIHRPQEKLVKFSELE